MDDFLPPEDLISAQTLALLEASVAATTKQSVVKAITAGMPEAWWECLDPATAECIREASVGWADGPPDEEATSPDRLAEQHLSRAATQAGYVMGRILLGTVDVELRWSTDVDAAADELTETLERLDFSDLDIAFVDLVFVEEHAAALGHADNESLSSMGLMAFDNALALALLEHDRARSVLSPVEGASAQRDVDEWVTKSAMTRYARCPYSWWLIESGELTFEEAVGETQLRFILEGVRFHERVEDEAEPSDVAADDVAGIVAAGDLIVGTADFRNEELRLFGRPDGIDPADGALYPVEVKMHKDKQRLDVLELAYYWLLLEPYRTRRDVDPEGRLLLLRGEDAELVHVPLLPHHFAEVERLVGEVRSARRRGSVAPRVCGCHVCGGQRRKEIRAACEAAKDLSMIFMLGEARQRALQALGVRNWTDLLAREPVVLAEALKASGIKGVGPTLVAQWVGHAHAYEAGAPVLLQDAAPFPIGPDYVTLDLEYDSAAEHVWLIGACAHVSGERHHLSLWADDVVEQDDNFAALASFLRDHDGIPVVTWSGSSAEVPVLRAANARMASPCLDDLLDRHVDVYAYVVKNLRLPIPRLGAKEVASYFGAPRVLHIEDGFDAVIQYNNYRYGQMTELRKLLVDYNLDDVDGLVTTVEGLRHACEGALLEPA